MILVTCYQSNTTLQTTPKFEGLNQGLAHRALRVNPSPSAIRRSSTAAFVHGGRSRRGSRDTGGMTRKPRALHCLLLTEIQALPSWGLWLRASPTAVIQGLAVDVAASRPAWGRASLALCSLAGSCPHPPPPGPPWGSLQQSSGLHQSKGSKAEFVSSKRDLNYVFSKPQLAR